MPHLTGHMAEPRRPDEGLSGLDRREVKMVSPGGEIADLVVQDDDVVGVLR